MRIGNRMNKPAAWIPIASMCLVVGILWPYLFHPTTTFWKDASEGLRGLLFGASIGINLMAARLARRQRRCGASSAATPDGNSQATIART